VPGVSTGATFALGPWTLKQAVKLIHQQAFGEPSHPENQSDIDVA